MIHMKNKVRKLTVKAKTCTFSRLSLVILAKVLKVLNNHFASYMIEHMHTWPFYLHRTFVQLNRQIISQEYLYVITYLLHICWKHNFLCRIYNYPSYAILTKIKTKILIIFTSQIKNNIYISIILRRLTVMTWGRAGIFRLRLSGWSERS